MRLVVTGGRYFSNAEMINSALSAVHKKHGITVLIHGAASGADKLCAAWAANNGIDPEPYPVTKDDWDKLGKAAGPMRNQRMIDEGRPDAAVAFAGDRGTRDMKARCVKAGIPVWDTSDIKISHQAR